MAVKKIKTSTQTLTLGAILTALVVVLQFLAIFVKSVFPLLPFTVSLVLVPIVVGAAKIGPGMGAWLGFVFAMTVLLSGDAAAFLVVSPIGTVLTVLVKGILCGYVSGLTYKLLSKKSLGFGVSISAIICPIVNTGVFFIGCLLFFMDTVSGWAQGAGYGENVAAYMFIGLAGFNFLFEFVTNLLLCPTIVRLIKIKK